MDQPRLRALDVFPVRTQDGGGLALRDPAGMTDAIAVLPPTAVAVVQLFDGARSRSEIQAEFERRHGQRLPTELLDRLIRQLDDALLLESDRFHDHARRAREHFAQADVRKPAHADRSYPGDPDELRSFLDRILPRRAAGNGAAEPRALIAPHIDLHRGGAAYGKAYAALGDAAAELFVVLGTDHVGIDQPFTLTRKHYDTPLGRVATDVDLVGQLARRLGDDPSLFADELHHRTEHSIEFQALLLAHRYGAHRVRVLPILCGSLHTQLAGGIDPAADPRIGRVIDVLGELLVERRACIVAGADLAHVGPRFGDARALGKADRARLREQDAATIASCATGSATAFWDDVRRDGDERRICGIAPIYHALRLLGGGRGVALAYDQCAADEDGGSLVSIAAVALR
jgi:AmmeMemoRadiSam system protein B